MVEPLVDGCGVAPRDDPLSPVAVPSALDLPFLFSVTFSRLLGVSAALEVVDEPGADVFVTVVGEDFAARSAGGEGDRSLTGCLRSLVDALRVETGVSVG